MTSRVVGVVCALRSEARHLARTASATAPVERLPDGTLLAVSGMGSLAARAGAERLVASGATALASFGMAGALDPRLPAGLIFLPEEVACGAGAPLAAEPRWHERLGIALAAHAPLTSGRLVTTPAPVTTLAAKAALFAASGARAVDMESAAIAEVAARRQLPFVAARVIVDRADDELPRAVVACSRGGEVDTRRLLVQLARRPWELAALLRLAGRYTAAGRGLAAIAGSGALLSAGDLP